MAKCKAITAQTGLPCRADALTNADGMCYFHSKLHRQAFIENSRKAGRKTHRGPALLEDTPVRLRSAKDVVRLMADTIRAVRCGRLDVKIASVCGYLGMTALNALNGTEQSPAKVELIIAQPSGTIPVDPDLEELERRKKEQNGKASLSLVATTTPVARA